MRTDLSHTWVEVGGRALLTHVHLPDTGTSRGAVVLVEGVGRDQAVARRAQMVLADLVARAGFTAVRFHLSGTVDSADPDAGDDRDVVTRWTEDIAGMVEHARAVVPGDVRLTGLRLGGLLAAEALRRHELGVERLVVWDALGSGRTWLRGAQTLHRMSAEFQGRGDQLPPPEGWHETAGLTLRPSDGAAVRTLRLDVPIPCPLDIVLRSEPVIDKALTTALAMPGVTTRRVDGFEALVDRTQAEAVVPLAAMQVVAALVTADAGEPRPAEGWPVVTEATVRRGRHGQVRERIVEVAGFHAVETVVPDAVGSLLTIPGATDAKDGPTGLWTRLARDAAERGWTSLRSDRTDIGENADLRNMRDLWVYGTDSPGDIIATRRWFAERTGHEPVLLGLCSGAWVAEHAALREPVGHILGINHVAWSTNELLANPFTDDESQITAPPATGNATARVAAAVTRGLKRWLPYPVYHQLAARHKVEAPGPWLIPLAAAGTYLHLAQGTVDAAYWRRQRGPAVFDIIRRRGGAITVEVDDRLDHSLFAWSAREAAVAWSLRTLDEIVGRPALPPAAQAADLSQAGPR